MDTGIFKILALCSICIFGCENEVKSTEKKVVPELIPEMFDTMIGMNISEIPQGALVGFEEEYSFGERRLFFKDSIHLIPNADPGDMVGVSLYLDEEGNIIRWSGQYLGK